VVLLEKKEENVSLPVVARPALTTIRKKKKKKEEGTWAPFQHPAACGRPGGEERGEGKRGKTAVEVPLFGWSRRRGGEEKMRPFLDSIDVGKKRRKKY